MTATEWQPNGDGRANLECAGDANAPTVEPYQFVDERQTDTSSLLRPGSHALNAVESLKQAGQFVLGNTDSRIADDQFRDVSATPNRDANLSREGKFEGIGE